MTPFTQTGFNTPFAWNCSPFFGGFSGVPFNSGFGQGFGAWNNNSWNTPFYPTNAWNPGWNPAWNPAWNQGFGFNDVFGAGFNQAAGWGFNPGAINGFAPGFFGAGWNTPFGFSTPINNAWNTPFPGFAPFAGFPAWNAFAGPIWNANAAPNGVPANARENTPFNASAPISGYPVGFPFFAPGAFSPYTATPNGEATPARNAA